MASDGKWYEPSSHPDPNYRSKFADSAVEAAIPEEVVADEELSEDDEAAVLLDLTEGEEVAAVTTTSTESARSTDTSTSTESSRPQPESKPAATSTVAAEVPEREEVATVPAGTSGWIDDRADNPPSSGFADPDVAEPLGAEPLSTEQRAEAVQAREKEERRLRLEQAQRSAELLRDSVTPSVEVTSEETVETLDTTGTADELERDLAAPSVAGRTKLEIDGSGAPTTTRPKPLHYAEPAEATTTALVHVPGADESSVDPIDRLLAVLLFLSGIVMVVGAFMTWTTGPSVETGWERPDGVVVVIAGAIAAASAGSLFGGFVVPWARGIAITAGVVGLMGVGVVIVTTLTEMELTGRSLGVGVYVVAAATLSVIVASLASNGHPR